MSTLIQGSGLVRAMCIKKSGLNASGHRARDDDQHKAPRISRGLLNWRYPGEKERVHARFIVENTRFLCQISRVLPHGTAPNRLFPVRSKTKLRKELLDSVGVRTFGY